MSKRKKKRTKAYRGVDAANRPEVVHHYVAEKKSPIQEWWQTNKKLLLARLIQFGVLALLFYLLWALVTWVI